MRVTEPVSFDLPKVSLPDAETMLRASGAAARIIPASGGADSAFDFSVLQDADEDVAFSLFSLQGQWSVEVELDIFVVATAPRDPARWSIGAQHGLLGASPVVFGPGQSAVHVADIAEVFEVQFNRAALERSAADILGVEDVRLTGDIDSSNPAQQDPGWAELLRQAHRLLTAGALVQPHVFNVFKAHAARMLLTSPVISTAQRTWRLAPGTRRTKFRDARIYLQQHATAPISDADVARAVELPLAVLDDLFREQTGLTTAGYLHATRIAGARAETFRSDPALQPAIQARWGLAPVLERHMPPATHS